MSPVARTNCRLTLQVNYYGDIQVEELLLRQYKPVAQRLRPVDIMTAHTGYLVFARKIVPTGAGVEPEEAAVPPLTADGSAHLGGVEEA